MSFDLLFIRIVQVLTRGLLVACTVCVWCNPLAQHAIGSEIPAGLASLIRESCADCHEGSSSEAGLDLIANEFALENGSTRQTWIRVYDRVKATEMPPDSSMLADEDRDQFLQLLEEAIVAADLADISRHGRGPMRRLTREEYEQNLRDLLALPNLDIRDMLPADRESHRFNKTAIALDMSRVQLAAYLDAAEAALNQAVAKGDGPLPMVKFRAIGTQLFPELATFGEREAMFFAKGNEAVATAELAALHNDPELELALFRSAHWPYYGYPKGFVAQHAGEYRVRFSARAVLQLKGYKIQSASAPIPMTFRARKPSGPDVSGDVRATGGVMDVMPEAQVFETTIRLLPTETFEYSVLGLPVPLARNVDGGPPTYRYPPFPEDGQPGVAIQWLEVEGPLPPESWPPQSHRILFDDVGTDVAVDDVEATALRLLHRFVKLAAREPVSDESLARLDQLGLNRIREGSSLRDALLTGYQAYLCSSHFLYLSDPSDPAVSKNDHYAIASRLSHFLTNSRPDSTLLELAARGQLRDPEVLRRETASLIASQAFERMVGGFTDYWLDLKSIRRDEPDIRLYPEYRFDDYLIESMANETQAFFRAMVRENLPATVLVDADFVYANDRLASHYGLDPIAGSQLRKIQLPSDSPYGGLLTQAAIMKVTSKGTSTSPVIRGAWVMERILGEPPPPPPKSVPAVEPDIRGAKSIRELLALHTKSAECAGCHARFDPPGMAMENFDIFGRWRDRYRSIEQGELISGIDRAGHDFAYRLAEPIDASGQLRDGRPFRDIYQLKALLAQDTRQLARNLLHQFTIYATGTPVRFSDRAEIEAMLDACADDGYRVGDLLHALVQSRVFLGKDGCR